MIALLCLPTLADGRRLSAQQPAAHPANNVERAAADFPVTFVDVAAGAGLTAPIIYGGVERKRYIIETNGCGVAFFDYDRDGRVDILLLNGTRLEGFPAGQSPTIKLYRNKGDGTFADVTQRAGLARTG